jgi:hypothetical protein
MAACRCQLWEGSPSASLSGKVVGRPVRPDQRPRSAPPLT